MPDTPKAHWLKENKREYSPHRVLVVDTETREDNGVQTLRLWCAELMLRHGHHGKGERLRRFHGTTVDELAALVDRQAVRKDTLWVYAHNASFDLAVTRLPEVMCMQGWQLGMHALTSPSPWARLSHGERRIVLADSFSILPTSVKRLGLLIGKDKPDLPAADAGREAWAERCAADVAITRRALEQVMDWWDQEQLGNWTLTGPGIGWNAMRHMANRVPVLIQPDAWARGFERKAIMGGRREVWRTGRQGPGLYADLDFTHAHLSICEHHPLPTKRGERFESLPLDAPELRSVNWSVLAEVELETDTPRYPWDSGRGVFYPVGRFRTYLAGPEITEALRRGELRAIHRGYRYRLAPHMRDWARWVRTALDGEDPSIPPAALVAMKGWSRSVPGRWATRTGEVVMELRGPVQAWRLERGVLHPSRQPVWHMTLGNVTQVIAQDVDGENAFPAVLAWVQSWTRVYIGRLVDALAGTVVQCNTDGAIIDVVSWAQGLGLVGLEAEARQDALREALETLTAAIAPEVAPLGVRVKRVARSVDLISPQHVVLDEERRLAGVPATAVELEPHVYHFTAWPRLHTQVEAGDVRGYKTQDRVVHLVGVTVNRWVDREGVAWPITCHVDPDGSTHIAPPIDTDGNAWPLLGDTEQHPVLEQVLAGEY